MKFEEFVEKCNQLLKDSPEYKSFEVVSSSDEGYSFDPVHYSPSAGMFDPEDREFYREDYVKELNEEYLKDGYEEDELIVYKPNAICIN